MIQLFGVHQTFSYGLFVVDGRHCAWCNCGGYYQLFASTVRIWGILVCRLGISEFEREEELDYDLMLQP